MSKVISPPRDFNHRIRHDLLFRLRWDIFADLNEIEILIGPPDQTIAFRLFEHPFANESLVQPPISRIDKVCLEDCEEKRCLDENEEEYRYQPPPGLTISNEDGSPITLGQLVTEMHAYFDLQKEEITRTKAEIYGEDIVMPDGTIASYVTYGKPYLPPGIKFFCSQIHAVEIKEKITFSVKVFAEGELRRPPENFWRVRMRTAFLYEQWRPSHQDSLKNGKSDGSSSTSNLRWSMASL